jgi:hypothetical protein
LTEREFSQRREYSSYLKQSKELPERKYYKRVE